MTSAQAGLVLSELERLIGRELPLDVLHGVIRRTAQAQRGVSGFGTCLVTCSDEFQSELRLNFDRDVARPLLPQVHSRTFACSNMAGRVEPGALSLAEQHFTARGGKAGAKLLLVEIAAHVGRRAGPQGALYGELDRFGVSSPCCGALTLLIDPPEATQSVRHPWFDQLSAFFGPARLGALRADGGPYRMVSVAIVHAVLQSESALTDLLRDPPASPTHVLIVPVVVLNQRGSESAILVGWHHVWCDGTLARIEQGWSLRSTPSALRFVDGLPLQVSSPWDEDEHHEVKVAHPEKRLPELHAAALETVDHPRVRAELERTRHQVEHLRRHPSAWRVYARPVLRGLLQALSVVAPEVGLAALVAEGAGELAHAQRVRRLLASGPTSEEARRVMHDLEPELQQLGHRQALEVLETLLATQRKKK